MSHRRTLFGAIAFVLLAAAILLLVQLGGNVRKQIDALATANSDSTQWSLAQVDVELLALKAAILAARLEDAADLKEVRQRFDVLYSRIGTVANSPLYSELRIVPEANEALSQISLFLERNVPLIDGDDERLRRSLSGLARETEEIRPVVRQIAVEGVSVLARSADSQRHGISNTLSLVSAMTASLLLVLVLVLAMLLRYARIARKQVKEEGLLRSRLASIVATSLDAVLVVGRDGRVIDYNGAAENIFGYTRDEAIGARMEDLIVPTHLKAAHKAGMDRYLKTGEEHVIGKGRVQLEACRKNGEVFPVEISISTAMSDEGEIFVSFLRDISRRVASEQELIKARDDAVAGEKAKAELIAVMSHEMRTPLNGMLGTLELIDPERRGPKDDVYLDIIRASGKQLLHHVDNVLEVSSAEAGRIVFAREVFSIPALVNEVVESQRGVAEHRGNALSHVLETNGRDYAIGDATRIRQVLLNLVGNSIKFTRNGTIRIEAERLKGSDFVEFRVIDTGIGIAEADQDRIFDEFVTLDASYSRNFGGTGLGLAIVKRLAVAMGGAVGLDSTPGKGSVFRVRVPLPEPEKEPERSANKPSQANHPQEPARLAPSKILIVEDNRINRVVLRDLLEKDGHEVDEAADGQQGVERALKKSYDLVFMDISMPVLDGVEATRTIRQSEARGTRLPIVALTAHARDADKERFRAAGLDDIVVKPISRRSLREVMSRMLGIPASQKVQPAQIDQTSIVFDQIHFNSLAETLGVEKASQLVTDFLGEMSSAVESISQRLNAGAIGETLRQEVHHAAGSAALLGTERLRDELARLEDRLKEGRDCGPEEAQALEATWSDAAQAIHEYWDAT